MTIYPKSDPEFSRKSSHGEVLAITSGPRKDSVITVDYNNRRFDQPPPPVLVSSGSEVSRPSSGKHTQDHGPGCSTPPRESCTPVDAEGKELV